MPKFTVNPDSDSAWDIDLRPGLNLLGRGAENDFQVEHPSVSSSHCQVMVTDGLVTLKDLGSISGTFVGDDLIEQATLQPGQIIRIGDVLMRFESDFQTSPAAGGSAANTPAAQTCKSHPRAAARYYCANCASAFCELCVSTRMANGIPVKLCRSCGGECNPLFEELPAESPVFSRLIGGAFTYPFKHDGVILLVAGTVFYSLMNFLARHAFLFGIILMILGTGYLISYMQRILVTSAMGEKRMPDWPDFGDFSDVTSPFIQFLGAVILSFSAAILLKIFAPADAQWMRWAYPAAIAFGCVYFPMSFAAVAMFDSLGALNPLLVFTSILKIPGAYLLAVVLLLAIYVASGMGTHLLEKALPIPILPGLISEFLGLYLMTVEMRILGLLYWSKKTELGWFRHRI